MYQFIFFFVLSILLSSPILLPVNMCTTEAIIMIGIWRRNLNQLKRALNLRTSKKKLADYFWLQVTFEWYLTLFDRFVLRPLAKLQRLHEQTRQSVWNK